MYPRWMVWITETGLYMWAYLCMSVQSTQARRVNFVPSGYNKGSWVIAPSTLRTSYFYVIAVYPLQNRSEATSTHCGLPLEGRWVCVPSEPVSLLFSSTTCWGYLCVEYGGEFLAHQWGYTGNVSCNFCFYNEHANYFPMAVGLYIRRLLPLSFLSSYNWNKLCSFHRVWNVFWCGTALYCFQLALPACSLCAPSGTAC